MTHLSQDAPKPRRLFCAISAELRDEPPARKNCVTSPCPAPAGVESHIFNTVGSGVKGGGTPGYACYGATKRGLPQLTQSLVRELTQGVQGISDPPETVGTVNIHTISPGMVIPPPSLTPSLTPSTRFLPSP